MAKSDSAVSEATKEMQIAEDTETDLKEKLEESLAMQSELNAKLMAANEDIAGLQAVIDAQDRKTSALTQKHEIEIERLEDEIAETARAHERQRQQNQSSLTEMMEKRLMDAGDSANSKLKKTVQSVEVTWKAKLKNAMDDQFELEKRLAKQKLATESAHAAEIFIQQQLVVTKAELEEQRDDLKSELLKVQQELSITTERLEKEQKTLKRFKSKAKKEAEGAEIEHSMTSTEVSHQPNF